MSDYNFARYVDQMQRAQDPAVVAAMSFDQPGIIDRARGASDADILRLMQFKKAREDELYGQSAAPFAAEASRLNRIAANDPYVGSAEGLADFAQRPDFWLGADGSGVVPGVKKGISLTSSGYNPVTAGIVQNFGNQNQNILDAFRVTGDMPQARLMQNKDLSNSYKDVTQGAENTQKVLDAKQKPITDALEKKNLADFLASSSMLTTPSERTGQMMPFGEASQLVQQAASDYPVKPELVNTVTDNLLAQYDKTRKPVSGKTGRTTWTGTQNLLGDINKDVASTAPNIHVSTGEKTKNPSLYVITKPDGRTVQIDATTDVGRARLNSALSNGERVNKMGTESESTTMIAPDGSTSTRRVSGAIGKNTAPSVVVTRDPKTGKLVVKR